jgi:hypothetical protein
MQLPDNARRELKLYFRSPSLGRMMFNEVDASPEQGGEVELLSESVAETHFAMVRHSQSGARGL